jgi:signal transduction histidine kinase
MGLEDVVFPADRQLDLPLLERMMAGEIPGYQVEKRFSHKAGHQIWGLLNVALMRDADGQTLYFIAQIADISDRHKLDVIKDEFISVVSHELRTPLTVIRGSLGMLGADVLSDEPETARRMLQVALNNTNRLVHLVNDILDLERLESGEAPLVMEVCELSGLIEQAVESVQPIADQSKIKLEWRSLVGSVQAAPDAIVQALTNLLSNAIKFSPCGSTVWLKAELEENIPLQDEQSKNSQDGSSCLTPPCYILFSVTDQGRGIPPDRLQSIFGRFQQVDSSDSRQKGGTGLGLAICKSIVHKHRGEIWVESVIGQGSTFYFTLPATKANHEAG